MKIILLVFLIGLAICGIHAEEELFTTCPELKGSKFEMFSNLFSVEKPYKGSKFFVALKNEMRNDGLMEINSENLSTLMKKNVFDVSLKTYVIIHGYRSNCQKPWVLEMKNKILKNENANVILVDWKEGSYSWNYIDSVRTTTKVSHDLFELLKSMKAKIPRTKNVSPSWNHLRFIGHSLGAHIAGQTGYLLQKDDSFFKVERITGLDPAWPCFAKAKLSIKLDKQDADFVEVIHTQTIRDGEKFGLGLKTPIGHVDFYVNGGVAQPACETDSVFKEFSDLFCDHGMAYRYFIESMDSKKDCPIEGHPWDQTFTNAIKILENLKKGKPCHGCIELGKDRTNEVENYGTYLVFTSAESPYCSLKKGDLQIIKKELELLLPPKKQTTIWNYVFNTEKSPEKKSSLLDFIFETDKSKK